MNAEDAPLTATKAPAGTDSGANETLAAEGRPRRSRRDSRGKVDPAARERGAPPTNKWGRRTQTREYIAAARRFVRGAGARVGDMDLAELGPLAALAREADAVLVAAARRLHDECGYSWTEIGMELGYANPTSARNGAWRRFGKDPRT